MYAEVDFLLALVKDDDWLGESAERIYREHHDELWTSHYALLELMLVAYREDRNVERVVADASELLDVRGDVDLVLAAASYVSERGMTQFDAIHAVAAEGGPIVSSDSAYDDVAERVPLEENDG